MALPSTLHKFSIELADIDRGIYETLNLRTAKHPSEDADRVIVRVLARALAHEEGLDFGKGLSVAEEPSLWKKSPTGDIELWIDVGQPSADRIHLANKKSRRVILFTHKPPAMLRKEWSARQIFEASKIEVVQLDADLVNELAEGLERSADWYLTVQDNVVTLSIGERSLSGGFQRHALDAFLRAETA